MTTPNPGTGPAAVGTMELALILGIGGFIACYTALLLATGWGLKKFKPWARWTGLFCAIPTIASFPIGTIIAILIGRALLRKEAAMLFSEEYREVRLRTPHVRYKSSPVAVTVLLIIIGLIVVCGVAIMITA